MLSKLLKYDLKSKIPFLCIFYALAIGCALLSRVLGLFSAVPILHIIAQIFAGATISMIFNILINNTLRSWALFRQNLYGDPSYLTHTLPVERTTVYLSKALDGLITLALSFAISGIALVIQYYGTNLWDTIKFTLQQLSGGRTALTACIFVAVLFLEIVNLFQCGFAGLILGHKANKGKIGFSVLAGLGVYTVGQLLILAAVGIISLFNGNVAILFTGSDPMSMDVLLLLGSLSCILYAALIVGTYCLNVKLLKQGVNVD